MGDLSKGPRDSTRTEDCFLLEKACLTSPNVPHVI